MNHDRSFFVAFNDCGQFGIEAIVNPTQVRAEVVDLIRRGDFGKDDVIAVHEYNPVEGYARDITEDIFREAGLYAEAAE
jgi:hypothetical protein